MRYVDLAVAALIGASAIAGVVTWTPRPWDAETRRLVLQTQLRDDLLGYLQARGTVWFASTPPGQICAALQASSNSTVAFSAAVGGARCSVPPPGAVVANLTLDLLPGRVMLEAWSAASE